MVDVLNPKDESELASDRDLSPPGGASSDSNQPAPDQPKLPQNPEPQSQAVQQQDTGNQEVVSPGSQDEFVEFLAQPAPLQFDVAPQQGYRGDLIGNIDPQGDMTEELLQKQAQYGQESFHSGLLGVQAAPERLAEPFDWTKGRPIEQIREELDIRNEAGVHPDNFNFLPGSGEISEKSNSVSSDLSIAADGPKTELGKQFQNTFDPDLKFNASRSILDLFSLPIKALTGVDLQRLASPEFYKYDATDEERALIDRYRAENAAPLLMVNKVLERLDRQYVEDQSKPVSNARGIEPRKLNFNLWEGSFGDFGNAGLISGATYLLSLPENIIMAGLGELVEVFNKNIPGRERNRFLDALAGRDMGIFEERTSDYKIFSILEPQELSHGVEVSKYEEKTGRRIPGIIEAMWDSPEFFQEQYGVSKDIAKIPYYAIAGAGLVVSMNVDDLFWKPVIGAGRVLRQSQSVNLDKQLRRLSTVGINPDAPDFLKPVASPRTKSVTVNPAGAVDAADAPTTEMVRQGISQDFGTDKVPDILYEDLGEFQVLEWKDRSVPERVIRITDGPEKQSLDIGIRRVKETRDVGESLEPIAESRGRLLVRSSDARTESVILLDKTEDVPEIIADPWDTGSNYVNQLEEFEELRGSPATQRNLTRAEDLKLRIDGRNLSESAVVPAEAFAPPSVPSETLKELRRNPDHRVALKDASIVQRTDAELTWLGKNFVNPADSKPYVNPNRSQPLSPAQINQLNREHGILFSRYGSSTDPKLSVATHVESSPGRVRRLRRAEEVIETRYVDEEIFKPVKAEEYIRLRESSKRLARNLSPIEAIKNRAETKIKLDRITSSMKPDELFKVRKKYTLPETYASDTDLGENLVDLHRQARVLRDDSIILTEEIQAVEEILESSEVQLDNIRNYARKDIGADLATKRLYGEPVATPLIDVLDEEAIAPSELPKVSDDLIVFFGTSSTENLNKVSIDEVEANELGLGVVGFIGQENRRIADSYALRSRQINAIPMGQGKPSVTSANTNKLALLDGEMQMTRELRTAIREELSKTLGDGTAELFNLNGSIADVLKELKTRMVDLSNVSELEYRNFMDSIKNFMHEELGVDGIRHKNMVMTWQPEKLAVLDTKALPEPDERVARLADYTVDAFLDTELGTVTSAANKAQSYRNLVQSFKDNLSENLARVYKKQVEVNRNIIDTNRRLKETYIKKKKESLDNLKSRAIEDFTHSRRHMKPEYMDPC